MAVVGINELQSAAGKVKARLTGFLNLLAGFLELRRPLAWAWPPPTQVGLDSSRGVAVASASKKAVELPPLRLREPQPPL